MDLGLMGKRAIVTGGKRGIGFAIAATLVREGASVAICARDDAAVATAVAHLREQAPEHGDLRPVITGAGVDLSDKAAYQSWLAAAVEELGGLDVFVHNVSASAGRGEDGWRNNLELDVLGLVRAEKVILPALEAAGGGSIVCLSSIAAQEEFAGPGSYGPMKAAMVAYANNLGQAQASKGIRVNIVSPGPVFFEGGNWDVIKQHMPQLFDSIQGKMPTQELGDPQQIADIVAFLASPRATLVTGANVVADGGFTKRIKF